MSGVSAGQRGRAKAVREGDLFFCYVTVVSRWCGVCEIESPAYEDATPVFEEADDPWVVRFRMRPIVALPLGKGIPIKQPHVWSGFSRTRGLDPQNASWPRKALLQGSLAAVSEDDAAFLQGLLLEQARSMVEIPLSEKNLKDLRKRSEVKTSEGTAIRVSIPDAEPEEIEAVQQVSAPRESFARQADLVTIGQALQFRTWVPRGDRKRVEDYLDVEARQSLLENLPVNFDQSTEKTIENIDVLWFKGRTIVRAFEVEHTTAIYSGLLRMADLLTLQPNIRIRLHIVAPSERREKVFDEIRRPVFAFLPAGPLSSNCTFLAYDSIAELLQRQGLQHMRDSVLDEFAEHANQE